MRRLMDDGAVLKGASIGLGCLLVAFALMGAATQAFAEKSEQEPASAQTASGQSALRLGHVVVECSDVAGEAHASEGSEEGEDATGFDTSSPEPGNDDGLDEAAPEGCEMAVGVPCVRAYRITNCGEASHLRLASHTRSGELDHVNDLAVTEGDVEDLRQSSSTDELLSDETGVADASAASGSEDGGTVVDEETVGNAGFWRLLDDGYWYRSEPLEVGESIVVYVSVEIPFEEAWVDALSTGAASAVTETIEVEALQVRNAVIDLDSADPWGLTADEALSTEGSPLEDAPALETMEGEDR